jgi:hypothetical protein
MANRLISERRQPHLVWDPVLGEIAQLISVLRAGRALGAANHLDWTPGRVRTEVDGVNAEGRVCVQIGVLGHPGEPFTSGKLTGIEAIVSWLDSWGVPRRWAAGRPEGYRLGTPSSPAPSSSSSRRRSRVSWARGGHFGACQVPGCENAGPGAIDIDRVTGPHGLQARARLPAPRVNVALPVPA